MSSKAQHAKGKCPKQVWGLTQALEDLGEHDSGAWSRRWRRKATKAARAPSTCGRASGMAEWELARREGPAVSARHLVRLGPGHDP